MEAGAGDTPWKAGQGKNVMILRIPGRRRQLMYDHFRRRKNKRNLSLYLLQWAGVLDFRYLRLLLFKKFTISRPLCCRRRKAPELNMEPHHCGSSLVRCLKASAQAHSIPGFSRAAEGQGTGAFFFFFVMLLLPHSMRLATFYYQDDWEYKRASEQKEQRVAPSKMNINFLRTRTLVLLLTLLWT